MTRLTLTCILVVFIVGTLAFPLGDREPKVQHEEITGRDKKEEEKIDFLLHDVPFILQAPFAKWDNPRFQDGCEEANILMVAGWLQGKNWSYEEAEKELLALSHFSQDFFGTFVDTSASDTATFLHEYLKEDIAQVFYDVELWRIKETLEKGKIVIVPVNGQGLNPYFTRPGPERHMVLIRGFDDHNGEFITNDPGTRHGKEYRYRYEVLLRSIRDYPTGDHIPIDEFQKAMIVVTKL